METSDSPRGRVELNRQVVDLSSMDWLRRQSICLGASNLLSTKRNLQSNVVAIDLNSQQGGRILVDIKLSSQATIVLLGTRHIAVGPIVQFAPLCGAVSLLRHHRTISTVGSRPRCHKAHHQHFFGISVNVEAHDGTRSGCRT